MSRETEIRMQTLHDTNNNHSSGENLDPELYQLQIQLAAIQEQQRLQTLMIKQFQQQLKVYQQKHHRLGNEGKVERSKGQRVDRSLLRKSRIATSVRLQYLPAELRVTFNVEESPRQASK